MISQSDSKTKTISTWPLQARQWNIQIVFFFFFTVWDCIKHIKKPLTLALFNCHGRCKKVNIVLLEDHKPPCPFFESCQVNFNQALVKNELLITIFLQFNYLIYRMKRKLNWKLHLWHVGCYSNKAREKLEAGDRDVKRPVRRC